MYIGGKQARPDGGYSRPVAAPDGKIIGEVGEGNRKDIRNAVEAARAAVKWASSTEHNRAQILYYLAENLDARAGEFAERVAASAGLKKAAAKKEVDAAVSRLFAYGAWADKYEGPIHRPPMRGLALAVNEPIGVIGIACPEDPGLLGFVSLIAPAIAMGNATVVIPSESKPLLATDFYQVLDTSDVPGGRRQHRHRRQAGAGARARQARSRRCHLVFRRQSDGRRGGESVDRQSQADLDGIDRSATGTT